MRIYELAKKLGVKSKYILSELSKLGIEGKTHYSNIESDLIKKIEEVVLGGGIKQKEQPFLILQDERLQVLKRLKKERWKEYLKYDMPDGHIEPGKPTGERRAEILHKKDETEALLRIMDEVPETGVLEEKEILDENSSVKQKKVDGHRSIIAGLIISAIFIITVLFISVRNYYVLRDEALEKNRTKSMSVQKEETTGQLWSGNSAVPKNNEILSKDEEGNKTKNIEEEISSGKIYPNPVFTVQAGAFNDPYNARSLKIRLNKRGYHAFITISSSKERRIYKVLVGKFSNREKAEILSAKIKRVEGLQTFVTLLKKQYFKNSKASSLRVGVYKCLIRMETPALHFS
jgi:cell division septation protein DedD